MIRSNHPSKESTMATKRTTPAPVEQPAAEATEPTPQQIVNDGISRVIAAHGVGTQKSRYKAMRAIAWQAFVESIDAGDFDTLVERAVANAAQLPTGWELARPTAAPAPKAARA
jgi:hypothetical protein